MQLIFSIPTLPTLRPLWPMHTISSTPLIPTRRSPSTIQSFSPRSLVREQRREALCGHNRHFGNSGLVRLGGRSHARCWPYLSSGQVNEVQFLCSVSGVECIGDCTCFHESLPATSAIQKPSKMETAL